MQSFRWRTLLIVAVATLALAGDAVADQSSEPSSPFAGQITTGESDSCAVLGGAARCWGFGGNGRLGDGSLASIGDDETPGAIAPLGFGPGTVVRAISAGRAHTCALLSDGSVHCWGLGGNGRLGYASTADIASAAAAPPVALGGPATAISAGEAHTCALLVGGSVVCWGYAGQGRLGYGGGPPDPNTNNIDPPSVGDDETPASVGPVVLGGSAIAISAGDAHTCALLVGGAVRCWGAGALGALGYGSITSIGDNELPTAAGPVDLGGHAATAIDTGFAHTCAVLDDKSVRCWGFGTFGALGLGNTDTIGDNETPATVPSVDLGVAAGVKAITAGNSHSCALLEDGSVHCWGRNQLGQLGYGRVDTIGDDESPATVGAVALGPGRTAVAVAAGFAHTCALLDDQSVRCWGYGSNGRLGYCNERTIGDNELPSAVGPVDFSATGAGCIVPAAAAAPAPPPAATPPATGAPASPGDPRAVEAQRRRALRSCLRAAAKRATRLRKRARRQCLRRYGRTPGRVTALRARLRGRTTVVLTFKATGSDGRRDPAARSYLIRQTERGARGAGAVKTLCRGSCRFDLSSVGTSVRLTVTDLKPRTPYSYSVAARDNVSNRLGPRVAVRVRTG